MSPPRRILHVISQLDGYAAAQQLRILARAQIGDGSAVCVAAFRTQTSILRSWQGEGIPCRELQSRWWFDPFSAWRLASLVREFRPEVTHVWDLDALAHLAMATVRNSDLRRIATLLVSPPSVTRHLQGLDGYAIATEQLAHAYAERGIVAPRAAIVPPAITSDVERRCSKSQFLSEMRLPHDAQLIVTVGPLVRGKRLDEAIWHYELVRTLNERAVMLILGDGPDRLRLERYARLVSEPEVIKFLGYRDDIPAYLSLADVVWHTGEEAAISFAVLESMAAGVPVVASDVPINRSLIQQGETGYLAAAGSRAMFARYTLRVLENPDLAQRIGDAAAVEVQQKFSIEGMLSAYGEVYESVLATT